MDNLPVEKQGLQEMAAIQLDLSLLAEDDDITLATKLPFTKIAALGTGFEPVVTAFQSIFSNGATSGIYQVNIPAGGHLAQFRDGSGHLGTVLSDTSNTIVGQASLTSLVVTPAMISTLFMSVALLGITHKLDGIERTQQEILSYLKEKDKAERKGNLAFLSDVLNNYKYNWNNEKYKSNNHLKVLDIKQWAEGQIIFLRGQIAKQKAKLSLPHGDQTGKKRVEKIKELFGEYQISFYLYAFSSFLDVMLLENFDADFLAGVVQNIRDHGLHYREAYTECYNQLERSFGQSIQSQLLKGLSGSSKMAGKAAGKIPIISTERLEERLTGAGSWLENVEEKRISRSMRKFSERQDNTAVPFIESIETVSRLYNQQLELAFDKEGLYFTSAEK